MSTDSTLQCEDIRSVQEIFVHATYVPFHQLPSVGLPGFFRKFLCTRFTNYQVWGFPVFSGNFRARDVRTIHQLPSVGLPGFFRKFSCTRHTYHAQPTILGLAQARPNQLSHARIFSVLLCQNLIPCFLTFCSSERSIPTYFLNFKFLLGRA